MDSTTRIDDLPENVTMRVQNDATSYAPVNVHPNPHGNQQHGALPPPQQKQHRLPSRDIPMDQTNYQQDEEIQPNYMPRVKFADDYVKDYESVTDAKIKHHERGKARSSIIDRICTDLQMPVFVALLFFIFQMPLVNTMFFRRFSFLSIYNSDGNVNFYGIALKSILFGGAFYSLGNTIEYLTDI
jgi:hypothetical protein